jgi:hypothetical protein
MSDFREARVETTTVVLVLGFVLVLAWMVLRTPNSSLRLSFLFLGLHVRRGAARDRSAEQRGAAASRLGRVSEVGGLREMLRAWDEET